jgi:L-rhamnose isomerase
MLDPQFSDVAAITDEYILEYSKASGVQFSDTAIVALLEGGRSFPWDGNFPIDRRKLEDALQEIFSNLPNDKTIGQPEMTYAIKKSKCHYLWFC